MQKRKFPPLVKRWMADRNVYQAAKLLGVWDRTLNGYLDGRTLPTQRRIEPLAHIMGFDLEKVRNAVAHDRALRGRESIESKAAETSETEAILNVVRL